MCVVLDTNVSSIVLLGREGAALPEFTVFNRWLLATGPDGKPNQIVLGGEFTAELERNELVRKRLTTLKRAGHVRMAHSSHLAGWIDWVTSQSRRSGENDIKVLAVARATRARVLLSADEKLRADFLDTALISEPRGRCYPTDGDRRAQQACLRSASKCADVAPQVGEVASTGAPADDRPTRKRKS